MAEELEELLSFLSLDTRLDVKSTALQYVLGLTGSEDGRKLIRSHKEVIISLLDLTTDPQQVISKDAHLALMNLSASMDVAELMVELGVVPRFLELLVDKKWVHADKVCMILANLSRNEKGSSAIYRILSKSYCEIKGTDLEGTMSNSTKLEPKLSDVNEKPPSLFQLIDVFDRSTAYNKDANFNYLASIFLNLTQLSAARYLFLDRTRCLIPKLLPYCQFGGSEIRRGGVVGLIKNLCFEVDSHQWLLSKEIDLLPCLLLPLAGPEQFDEDEMEKLPEDLQYLPDDKQREADPDIRRMIIEALMKLCTTKFGREYLRDKQTYLVLRELHRWESDIQAKDACEKLVHILISDEPELGMENLDKVEVTLESDKPAVSVADHKECSNNDCSISDHDKNP